MNATAGGLPIEHAAAVWAAFAVAWCLAAAGYWWITLGRSPGSGRVKVGLVVGLVFMVASITKMIIVLLG